MTVKLRSRKDGWWKFAEVMSKGQDFNRTNDSLTGRAGHVVWTWGRLNRELDSFGTLLASAERAGTLEYVVYSYATPIAFKFAGTWAVTDERYSVTTTAHVNKIATAARALTDLQEYGC